MSNFRDFFIPDAVDSFPVLKSTVPSPAGRNPEIYGTGAPTSVTGSTYPGFNGDGDWVYFPAGSVYTINYYNSSDVLQWTLDPSDVNVAADCTVGVVFEGGLIYWVVADQSVSPERLYTATVNSSGTVTNIGNDVLSNETMPATNSGWSFGNPSDEVLTQKVGNSLYQWFDMGQTAPRTYFVEINLSDGSFITELTDNGTNRPFERISYTTPSGLDAMYTANPVSPDDNQIKFVPPGGGEIVVLLPRRGIGINNEVNVVIWDGLIYNLGHHAISETDYAAWLDEVARFAGVI